MAYPSLDTNIRRTYAEYSNSKLAKNLYDSYIRAIRWASDRIHEKGVVAFVTNGSFLDANNMDGLRKCLTAEYSHLYIFDLRGDQRTSGEESRREGGKIFGSGSRTPVAISIMVKDPAHVGQCDLHYHDIGDYLSREEKLTIIEKFGSIDEIEFKILSQNHQGDWINQRDPAFDKFIPIGDKDSISGESIFFFYSFGVVTARDPWVYSYSSNTLEKNIRRMIDAFNYDSQKFSLACEGKAKDVRPTLDDIVDTDPKRISWTRALKADAARGKRHGYASESVIRGMYRPFSKQWMYFDRRFNEMVNRIPAMFPTLAHPNIAISSTGVADRKGYSAFVTDHVPNMHLTDTGQCFPLYWYEKANEDKKTTQGELFAGGCEDEPDADGYIRREAITDWALTAFREQYQDSAITKEDIFWYVYGILHSPEYKQRFAADLKKMLPRIPFAADFWAFSKAGRELGQWHLDYETVEPWPVKEEIKRLFMAPEDYRVHKMVFGKKNGKPDKTVIVYNGNLTLREIPLEAYEYIVNGKPAIEWIMERYAVTVDKASGIKNDPNDWSDDPRYIVDLLKRVVMVSLETVRIVGGLPDLNEAKLKPVL